MLLFIYFCTMCSETSLIKDPPSSKRHYTFSLSIKGNFLDWYKKYIFDKGSTQYKAT